MNKTRLYNLKIELYMGTAALGLSKLSQPFLAFFFKSMEKVEVAKFDV